MGVEISALHCTSSLRLPATALQLGQTLPTRSMLEGESACCLHVPYPTFRCLTSSTHCSRAVQSKHSATVCFRRLGIPNIQGQLRSMSTPCCRMFGPCSSAARPCHAYHTTSGAAKSSIAGQLSAQHSVVVGVPNLQQHRHGTLQAPGSRRDRFSSIIAAAGDSQDADVKQCVTSLWHTC
jgi:hypothetical protein